MKSQLLNETITQLELLIDTYNIQPRSKNSEIAKTIIIEDLHYQLKNNLRMIQLILKNTEYDIIAHWIIPTQTNNEYQDFQNTIKNLEMLKKIKESD